MNLLWLWRKELAYLILFIIIAAVLSYFVGYFMHMLVLILISALIHQALLVSKLEAWLGRGAPGKVPVGSGIWGDIFYHFFRIKKAEKKRKKTLGGIIDKFRKSTDVLPDAAIVIGQNDEIEWSNKLAKLVLGIKKSDRGQRVDNLIRSPEFSSFLKNSDNKKRTFSMLSPVDANIILQFKMVEYGVSQRLIIAQDITQQRNMELMRKNFVDNVSHELRTPLTVLKGYLETLHDMDDGHSKMLTQSIDQMNGQTERMQYLVDDLLLLARLETKKNKNECINVPELIRKICLESNIIGSNQNRIHLNIETETCIHGVEHDLRSAFTNLIINALKYSKQNKDIQVFWKSHEGRMIFDVVDSGEGISESEIPKITKRFYRVDVKRSKKMSGTGLGLAIVKHVLLGHHARLEITSKLGEGSRFRCVFPQSTICEDADDNA